MQVPVRSPSLASLAEIDLTAPLQVDTSGPLRPTTELPVINRRERPLDINCRLLTLVSSSPTTTSPRPSLPAHLTAHSPATAPQTVQTIPPDDGNLRMTTVTQSLFSLSPKLDNVAKVLRLQLTKLVSGFLG